MNPDQTSQAIKTLGNVAAGTITETPPLEQVAFTQPLRGPPMLDEKTRREMVAVGGLRDTRSSFKRLTSVADFSAKL